MDFHFLSVLLDPKVLIATLGTVGVIGVVFFETGIFLGFFFPGDTLLFTAGFFAWQGHVPLSWLLIGCFVAAVLGDSVGYMIGRKIGPALFTREDSFFFNKKHIARAQHFYEEHGAKTIILARFMPIIRTFAPVVAGIGTMKYSTFILFNIIGGFLWTFGIILLGYGFGSVIPNPDRYIIPAIIIIILLSATPALRALLKRRV